jgi:hypothetical protein
MKNEHIISLIESTSFASLSESDLSVIRSHSKDCVECGRAFEAAQLSILLLKERVDAGEAFEPSPFFNTRVLARLRERQTANDSWAWTRVWRAAGALASSMVVTVAALAVLTFVVPENQVTPGTQEISSLGAGYSAEEVILFPNEVTEQPLTGELSDGQVLTTIYGGEE